MKEQGTVRRLVVVTILLLLFTILKPTTGFARPFKSLANVTRNAFLLPLRVDEAVVWRQQQQHDDNTGKDGGARGVVLNTVVGGTVFAGGLAGYLKAGSKASLMAGSIFGFLLFGSAHLIGRTTYSQEAANRVSMTGNGLGATVSTLLATTMGKKFIKSKRFMPAGFISVLASMSAFYNIVEIIILLSSRRRSKKDDEEEHQQN